MFPKLRPVEHHWVEHNGQQGLLLRDRLGLSDKAVIVPDAVAVLLTLCDGTRDTRAVRVAFELRTGMSMSPATLDQILSQLDEALLLESPHFEERKAAALDEYRRLAFRPPALAGSSYPADPGDLTTVLDAFVAESDASNAATLPDGDRGSLRGIVCPHIDYARGGSVYAKTWKRARQAVADADIVVIFGTDHNAGSLINLTRQSYATPWGALPTAAAIVDELADAVGEKEAFDSELHHRMEHSIELGAVWLHHALAGQAREVVPILCGSFEPFVSGERDLETDPQIERFVEVLRTSTRGRRMLIVAAADLAHVGPAFGDEVQYGSAERQQLADHDERLLEAVCEGSAEAFFGLLRDEGDRLRVCGLPPIYLALRTLGASRGELTAYAQCPADDDGTSLVSIAGALLS